MSREQWNDQNIEFCINKREMEMKPGEFVVGKFCGISNQRRSNQSCGNIIVTNLRIIWYEAEKNECNLSIGQDCVAEFKKVLIRTKLYALPIYKIEIYAKNLFPYIFLFQVDTNHFAKLYQTLTTVHRAYQTSRIYRNLILRGAVLTDGSFRTLRDENLIKVIDGFWNLSGDTGNLGRLYITNIRIVWISNMNEHFNASIPYSKITGLKVRRTKYGLAMAIDVYWTHGSYLLGFQMNPPQELRKVSQQIEILKEAYCKNPILGVFVELEIEGNDLEPMIHEEVDNADQVESDDDISFKRDDLDICFWNNQITDTPGESVYSPELGLAIETLPQDTTIESLWKVL